MTRTCAIVLSVFGMVFALPGYTGYSGAPGARGTCASSCHGMPGGTVTVTGFPSLYTPESTYVVRLAHTGGPSISNFNASVRIGTGSQTAGTITAGLNTTTYSRTEEPNGVHLSGNNRDSCAFNWTAPDSGTGDVRLYVAALQGYSSSGPNSRLTLTAEEGTGIAENHGSPAYLSLELRPTVVTGRLVIRVGGTPARKANLRIVDAGGRLVARFPVEETGTAILWTPADGHGRRLPDGTYFALLTAAGERLVRRFVIKAD